MFPHANDLRDHEKLKLRQLLYHEVHQLVMAAGVSGNGERAEARVCSDLRVGNRRAAGRARHGAAQIARWPGSAPGELERGNARLPRRAAGRLNVFVGIPESALVLRVHPHHAVIAPAAGGAGL